MRLKDQVAIVTGAGRNIGEDICRLFVQEGANVAVVDLDPGRGSRVAGEINATQCREGNFRCLRRFLAQLPWKKWFRVVVKEVRRRRYLGKQRSLDGPQDDLRYHRRRVGSDNECVSSKRLVLHPSCSAGDDRSKAKRKDH